MALQMTKDLFEVLRKKNFRGKIYPHYYSNMFSGHVLTFQAKLDLCDSFFFFSLISFSKIPLFCWCREQDSTHKLIVLRWVNTPRPWKYDSEPSPVQQEYIQTSKMNTE